MTNYISVPHWGVFPVDRDKANKLYLLDKEITIGILYGMYRYDSVGD